MSTKETNGRPTDDEATGEASRGDVHRVKGKSNESGKSAGGQIDAGEFSGVNDDDINAMLSQQEHLAAAIARSRRHSASRTKSKVSG